MTMHGSGCSSNGTHECILQSVALVCLLFSALEERSGRMMFGARYDSRTVLCEVRQMAEMGFPTLLNTCHSFKFVAPSPSEDARKAQPLLQHRDSWAMFAC
eukprot:5114876-Amphidinium_carterae.1